MKLLLFSCLNQGHFIKSKYTKLEKGVESSGT